MLENTLENKAKFFGQYWWQELCFGNRNKKHLSVDGLSLSTSNIDRNYLLLTPLSKITDADAIEVAKISGQLTPQEHYDVSDRVEYGVKKDGKVVTTYGGNLGWSFLVCETMCSSSVDKVRSLGYAIPYMGLSVEKLISYGWVKLKE